MRNILSGSYYITCILYYDIHSHLVLLINPNSLLHFVSVPPPLCYDGQVRLRESNFANGYYHIEGPVEICVNETYGTVCDEGWDDNAAAVVCRSMGLGAPNYGM